jgi:chorismate mutase/prephenate dehydratase
MKTNNTVAVLGPAGTNGHTAYMALEKRGWFPWGTQIVFADSHGDIFSGVENGHFSYGVVPIQNSTRGLVDDVMDFWIETCSRTFPSEVHIVAEQEIEILHCLAGHKKNNLGCIKKLYSRDESFRQCRKKLSELPYAERIRHITVSSTAAAAKLASEQTIRSSAAAIISEDAAKRYGLKIFKKGMNDSPSNTTRFHVVTKNGQLSNPTGHNKAIIMIKLENECGSLARVTDLFRLLRMNMTCIQSIPTGNSNEVLFYIEFVANLHIPIGTISSLWGHVCEEHCVIGQFKS